MPRTSLPRFVLAAGLVTIVAAPASVAVNAQAQAQGLAAPRLGVPAVPPPERPVVLYTAAHPRIRVVPVATGLSHPWSMAFRRNGDILVTERDSGALRIIRDGQLLDRAIPGVPEVYTGVRLAGLMDIAVHPDDDAIVYLTYSKGIERDGREGATVALARGRLDGGALTEVRDIFVAEGIVGAGISASRALFGPDGKLYVTVGGAFQFAQNGGDAQDPANHVGKLIRLNADGTVPEDNPFVGEAGHLPEIYSMGHRNQIGLAFHPQTGELWATENGPQGGDEANIIRAGGNYGWPLASFSRQYGGPPVTDTPWRAEFTGPEIVWWPSIAPSGLTFYTGDHFPAWKGNLFVGSMTVGRMERTGHLERIVFNRQGQEIRRESLLSELRQRIRDVRQGPDGYLYVLTEEDDAVLLRIEPARAITGPPGSIVPAVRLREPRVPPLPEAEWTNRERALVEQYAPGGEAGNALRTLMRAPGLPDRIFPFLNYVTGESTLSPRHRTILILRTAWLAQSGNLWATYASRAAAAGLTEEEVLQVARGSAEGFSEFEATLIGLPDELFRNVSVTDATWDLLSAEYDVHNLVDAVATVADITAAATLFNSLGIQPDESAPARMPVNDVGYRINFPDPDPPLAAPRVEPVDGDEIRIRRTLARHPELRARWYSNDGYVLSPERSRLTPHDRELLILRMGWNSQAVYEWAKHVGSVGRARDHGLEPHWIAQGGDAEGWNERELTLIDAANEMYRDTMISDATWERLSGWYDTHQLISIAATAARYRKVSMVLNALGVQPQPDDERFPVLEGYQPATACYAGTGMQANGSVEPRAADDLAVVLTGGGARGAYQIGVLRWIAQRYPEIHFPIVTGVSAGAISATFLAAWQGSHAEAIEELRHVWSGLTIDRIFRADGWSLTGHVARWGARLLSGGSALAPDVRGLVDAAPLAATLGKVFDIRNGGGIGGIAENVAAGRLWALALVTSHYGSGQSVVWTAGRGLTDWRRPDRHSRRATITLDHILASSALPLVFPAVRLDDGWHGDGGIRLTAPCSPALHLGANRVLAVSTRQSPAANGEAAATEAYAAAYPPPLQISGQLLNAVFLDDLDRDVLELERVNRLLRDVPPSHRRGLRPVKLVVVRPSVDISRLAAKYEPSLPPAFRYLIRGLGSRDVPAPDLLSLLAFQPEYLGRLIAIGEADAEAQAEAIHALLAG